MGAVDDLGADYAVAPTQVATAVALAAIGVLQLMVALFFVSGRHAVLVLIFGCTFMALFWGLLMWLAFRARIVRRRADLPVIERPVNRDERQGVRRGLVSAVVLALSVDAAAGVMALLGIEDADGVGITLGILLGAALWLALQARDLRRWEAATSLTLFTRSGARRVAWTGGQAQEQLVLVRAGQAG